MSGPLFWARPSCPAAVTEVQVTGKRLPLRACPASREHRPHVGPGTVPSLLLCVSAHMSGGRDVVFLPGYSSLTGFPSVSSEGSRETLSEDVDSRGFVFGSGSSLDLRINNEQSYNY